MSIAEVCVKRPVFAVMLISFLVVLGIFSFRDLGVDLFPRTDPATVTINVQLLGATAEEVSTQVILPLEEAVSSVSGLDELTSEASEGNARITCKFVLERDTEGAAQDVREKVAAAIKLLPPNILPPTIAKDDPDSDPVLSLLIAGGKNLRETTEIADKQIKRALETVNGVGEVDLTGGRLRQIRVFADAEKLNGYGITIDQLENAIQNQNVEVPGGTIRRGPSEMGVRTLGRVEAADEFNSIIVADVNGTPVRIKDIGRAEDSYAEPTTWNMLHGKEAVVLDVRRQTGTNTLQVIEAVKAKNPRSQEDAACGDHRRIHPRQFQIHQSVHRFPGRAPFVWQLASQPGGDVFHPQSAFGPHCGPGDPDLHRGYVHTAEGYEFHAQQHDSVGVDSGRGHCHR